MTEDRKSKRTPEERRIRSAIRAMESRAAPVFRERLKSRFVAGTLVEEPIGAGTRFSRGRRIWGWALVPATAAALLVVVLLARGPSWTLHGVSGEGRIVVNGEVVTARETERLAALVGPGARIRVAEGVTLDVLVEGALLLELDEQADVTIPGRPRRWLRRPLIGDVHAGELRVSTGPDSSGLRLSVRTVEGRADLVGTTISVYKGTDFTCVCVLQGTARIGRDDARMEDVPSGMRKVMFGDDRPSMVTEIEPHHQQGLQEFVERQDEIFRPER